MEQEFFLSGRYPIQCVWRSKVSHKVSKSSKSESPETLTPESFLGSKSFNLKESYQVIASALEQRIHQSLKDK